MSREQRRAAASICREVAQSKPMVLTRKPKVEWPELSGMTKKPIEVWESRFFLVQVFDEGCFAGRILRRLTVCRAAIDSKGGWKQDITWEELQNTIKNNCGYGNWYGIEIYPCDKDVVNVANMRHLWVMDSPLDIGWFK